MTNKKGDNKGDKKGDKRKQKGDKTDTVPNKKGDKTGDKERMKGDKGEKGGCQQCRHPTWKTKVNKPHGKQINRNDAWPAERADTNKSKEIMLNTSELKCCMASRNGRTPAVTERADTS